MHTSCLPTSSNSIFTNALTFLPNLSLNTRQGRLLDIRCEQKPVFSHLVQRTDFRCLESPQLVQRDAALRLSRVGDLFLQGNEISGPDTDCALATADTLVRQLLFFTE